MEMVSQGRPRLLIAQPPARSPRALGQRGSHFVAYPIPLVIQASPFTAWQADKDCTGNAAFWASGRLVWSRWRRALRPRANGQRSGGGARGETDGFVRRNCLVREHTKSR